MSNRQINIAVDAMGGEDSPFKCLKGIEIQFSDGTEAKTSTETGQTNRSPYNH